MAGRRIPNAVCSALKVQWNQCNNRLPVMSRSLTGAHSLPASSSCLTLHPVNRFSTTASSFASLKDFDQEVTLDPYVDPVYAYSFGRSTSYLSYSTIGRALDDITSRHGEKTAVISWHQQISKTYNELNHDAHAIARSLYNDVGIRHGDVVGIWSANVYEYIAMQFAIARLGGITCAISPLCKSPELEHILMKGKVKALVYPGPGSVQNFGVDYTGILSAANKPFLKHLIHLETTDEQEAEAEGNYDGLFVHTYDSLVRNPGKLPDEILESVSPDDVASIFFTSGTTGKPKGASTSHTTMLNCQRLVTRSKRMMDEDSGRRMCVPLPFFHAFAGMGTMNTILAVACSFVIPNYKFTAPEVVTCMQDTNCTDLSAVPAMAIDLMNYCIQNKTTIPSLKSILLGAANAPEHVVTQLYKVFPSLETVLVAYGCTETSPVATYPNFAMPQDLMNKTVGSVIDFGSLKIVDPQSGRLLRHNEVGEIHVKGLIMSGYWDEAEKTAEVLNNGWYVTGDLGIMDSRGLIKITGRTKELIIRGGANIYPKEVEDLIHKHENVLTVGICGVPHDRLGEEVCAWIKLRDPTIGTTAEEIRNFCRDNISSYKVPKYVFFVEDFPMTASGKFQKFLMTQKSIEMIKSDSLAAGEKRASA